MPRSLEWLVTLRGSKLDPRRQERGVHMEQRPASRPVDESGSSAAGSVQQEQVNELHRRIELLEAGEHEEFGAFTRVDWIACIVGSIVIPIAVLLWVGR